MKSIESESDDDDLSGEDVDEHKHDGFKNWRSTLIKSGKGSFLEPQGLVDKVDQIKARYGL